MSGTAPLVSSGPAGFLHHKAFRGAGAGVQEDLAQHVELLGRQGGEEGDQGLLLPGAFGVPRIGAEDEHPAGLQQGQGLLHGGEGGGQQGGDPVSAAGQPAQVEPHRPDRGGNCLGEMLMAVVQKPKTASATASKENEEGEWMSLKDLSALLKEHFKGYKEDTTTFQKIGNYLNRPEYKFESKRVTAGMLYWVQKKV